MFQSPLFSRSLRPNYRRSRTPRRPHGAELSAAITTPVAVGRRMNVDISSLLHEIPSIYFDYDNQGGELGHLITDIADLLGYDSRRPYPCVQQVIFPMMKERIVQRTRFLNSESDSHDDDDDDPSRDK